MRDPVSGDGDSPKRRFQVTEVRIKLTADPRNKLKAYCSVTIDDAFVIRDLKIIEGTRGPFVAMPSRKLSDHCSRCHHKNHLRASFCNHCGSPPRGIWFTSSLKNSSIAELKLRISVRISWP